MTTRLSARGNVAIPSKLREQLGLRAGDDFTILCSNGGQILLCPIRRGRKKGLFQALRALRGLELPPRDKELIRPIKF